MKPVVKRLNEIAPERGSCGTRRRLITASHCETVGLSNVQIEDARVHYHPRCTEIYYVLAGEGTLEVGEEKIRMAEGTAVLIPPGVRHRALSERGLEVLVIMSPASAETGDIVYVGDSA